MDLNIVWFGLLGVLMTGYAILDGFDFGVGMLYYVARDDKERRILLHSIGPFWDGNEVWLVTFGGALFAAFPECYATVFEAFYTAFMLLLLALIFRAVSVEFRSKLAAPAWRAFWDAAFCAASFLAPLLFGVAVGNAMLGMPIAADYEPQTRLVEMLGPFPLLVGLFTVSIFALHGALYLHAKTDGPLRKRLLTWIWRCYTAFLVLYAVTTFFALVNVPSATHNFRTAPWAWAVVALNVLAIANIPRAVSRGRSLAAWLSSACSIAGLTFLFGFAMFPNLAVSSLDPAWSLTIYNAASSPKTLRIMTVIAVLGMPFVLAYTSVIYWVFRGKVELGKLSY